MFGKKKSYREVRSIVLEKLTSILQVTGNKRNKSHVVVGLNEVYDVVISNKRVTKDTILWNISELHRIVQGDLMTPDHIFTNYEEIYAQLQLQLDSIKKESLETSRSA